MITKTRKVTKENKVMDVHKKNFYRVVLE